MPGSPPIPPSDPPFRVQPSERVTRLPPYLFGRINTLLYNKRRAGDDVIDLGMGNPSDPPEEFVIEKLSEAARDPNNHGYSKSNGIVNLRREVCGEVFQAVRRAARPGSGSDRLPGLERGLQPHVPGDDGAGRHGDRARAILPDPRVLGGAGVGQRDRAGGARQREVSGQRRLHLRASLPEAEAADRQLSAQSVDGLSSSSRFTTRWCSWRSGTASW